MEVGESWQAMMLQNYVDTNVRAPSGQHGHYNIACTDMLLAEIGAEVYRNGGG
jgi:hypothetical protein